MNTVRRRNRLVYFRITEEEFEEFKRLCDFLGARSMSELMRSALDRIKAEMPSQHDEIIWRRLQMLEDKTRELDGKLRQLTTSLKRGWSASDQAL